MADVFLKIVNMSISAGWIVLAVVLLRLLLKKAPKWITVILWGVVAVRLICPFSIESVLSMIPSTETVSPTIMTDEIPAIRSGVSIVNSTINPIIEETFAPVPGNSTNPLQIWIPILAAIWIAGMIAMLVYTAVSYGQVRRKIGTAVLLRSNIFQSENVASPFVLGIIKPKIYLPFSMDEGDMAHVIAHEKAHIHRKDHWWKPLGFLLLSFHWFNPLMWLGYILLCRDIELACDEKVIKRLDTEQKADYSQALLTCSVNRRIVAACPLAFGEVGVKERVKSVLKYKKPAFWLVVVAVMIATVFAGCFLTDPKTENPDPTDPTDPVTLPPPPPAGSTAWNEKINEYYNIDASNGLDVYVWQMAEGLYSFGLLPHSEKQRNPIDEELLKMPGVSHTAMAQILHTYDIAEEEIHIIPWQNPISSYIAEYWFRPEGETEAEYAERRAAYIEKIRYWLLDYPYETPKDLFDQIVIDIDGDGREEECYLTRGYTSGLSSFCFYMRETGVKKWECGGLVVTKEFYPEMLFEQDENGKIYINALRQGYSYKDIPDEWQRIDIKFSISSKGRTVEFSHNGESILYGQ